MLIDFPQILACFIVILWLDFSVLTVVRKLRFPDFFAHVLTGILIGLLIHWSGDWIPVVVRQDLVRFEGVFKFLIMAGLFFFFMEFGFRTPLKSYKITTLADFREFLIYSLVLGMLFGAAVWLSLLQISHWTGLLLLIIVFLPPALGGIVTGKFFDLSVMKEKFQDFTSFTLGQEIIALLLFLIFSVTLQFSPEKPTAVEVGVFVIGLLVYLGIVRSGRLSHRMEKMPELPLPVFLAGMLIIPLILMLRLNLPSIAGGFLAGVLMQVLLKRNEILQDPFPYKFTRFFFIFPLIAVGVLLFPGLSWMLVLKDALLILLILVLGGFALGLFWMRQYREFLVPSLVTVFRGELTLFLLLWGFMRGLVSGELIAAVFFLSVFLHLLARTGVFARLVR